MREMQSSPAATLSVVIPTCNRMADLELCLERLMPQFADVGGCEVIVTDDGDLMRTKTALAAKFPAVIWTQGPRRGAAQIGITEHPRRMGIGSFLSMTISYPTGSSCALTCKRLLP